MQGLVTETQEQKTESLAQSPLLTPTLPIDFASFHAADVEPAIRGLLDEMRGRIAAVADESTPRTYEAVLAALDKVTEPLDRAIILVRHLESVVTTPELRTAHNAIQGDVSEFYSSIPLNARLWSAVKAVGKSPDIASLSAVERRFLEKTLRDFQRTGADLQPEGKERLSAIDRELTEITTKYSQNVLDSTNAFELLITEEAKLAGLPEPAQIAARESAASHGEEGWRFTLQAPSLLPVLTYLDDRSIRQQMWEASSARATAGEVDNRDLVLRILRLRREKANMLGFDDFSDLVLEDRMAHDGRTAQAFVEDLERKTLAHFKRETAELSGWGRKFGISDLQPWDVAYVAEKQRLALYAFDEEALRPYFPVQQVMAGMFEIFSRLLGIAVVKESDVHGWDPAVEYFRVQDGTSGELLGGFYTDWFPRENKRGGAWMNALITGNPRDGKPHVGLICGNLTPPQADKPALLTFHEVETIFHEFGHLLHHLLSRVPVRSLAGTDVPWDFVELPSQIMENWCLEREALRSFARHYQTGEPIPDQLFEKMERARRFRAASTQMRQLGFALLDLKLHREFDPDSEIDVLSYSREILQRFTAAPLPAQYGMIASFTHLFAAPVAYGAGYYSYKWAEVLDADAFTRFKREGVFNGKTGSAFRQTILERGNSVDPAQQFRDFMGRDPDPQALLERLGLKDAA